MRDPEAVSGEIEKLLAAMAVSGGAGGVGAAFGPEAGVAALGLAPAVQTALNAIADRARLVRRRRVGDAWTAAATYADLDDVELLERLLADERKLELTARVLTAAALATDHAKVRALGRALAEGALAADGAAVDDQHLVVEALSHLTVAHVRILLLLLREPPREGDFAVGWYSHLIAAAMPTTVPGITDTLVADLVAWGLARRADAIFPGEGMPRWECSTFGRLCLERLELIGAHDRPQDIGRDA